MLWIRHYHRKESVVSSDSILSARFCHAYLGCGLLSYSHDLTEISRIITARNHSHTEKDGRI